MTTVVSSRAVPIILLAGAVILFALVLLSLRLTALTRDDAHEALVASSLKTDALQLFTLLQDAETSQRGYLLTGETRYLDPFRRAEILLGTHPLRSGEDLRAVGVHPLQVARFNALIGEKTAEMRETIDLKSDGRGEEALKVLMTGRGKRLMDEIRQIMVVVSAVIDRSTVRNEEELARVTTWLVLSTASGAALVAILGGGGMWLLVRRSRDLEAARNALAEHNRTLEERVRQRTRFLERANHELQSYSYIVSHDLRAPLVNIIGFNAELERSVGILQDHLARPELRLFETAAVRETMEADIPEALGFIRSSMRRMDDLIGEILKLARAGSRELQAVPVDLAEVVDDAGRDLRHRLDDLGGRMTVSGDLPAPVSDRAAIRQILSNILDNAVKYSQPGRPPEIDISGRTVNNDAVIEVCDNGRGIPDKDFERIFELFRRSGVRDQPGEGIGLAHVRALARRLGGDVMVRSVVGKGTTFTVRVASNLEAVDRGRGE